MQFMPQQSSNNYIHLSSTSKKLLLVRKVLLISSIFLTLIDRGEQIILAADRTPAGTIGSTADDRITSRRVWHRYY